jgi:hypothetical protein
MLIPRYWSRAESQATTPDGRPMRFHVWRGSRTSEAEAQAAAADAVRRMAERISRGAGFPERYSYGDRPMREEVVREIPAGAADATTPDAALTRNSYGALVLNAARAFFIDVDVDGDGGGARPAASSSASSSSQPAADALWDLVDTLPVPGGLKSILGAFRPRPAPKPAPAAPAAPPPPPAGSQGAALELLRRWVAAHPEWLVRVYRTSAGLRYLVTHALFSPADAEAQSAMTALGADPQYVRLCSAQKSFRARLTPKPWRIGMENPPVGFPYESASDEQAMRAWERRYEAASNGHATCQFLEEMGGGTEHPDVTPLRTLHDEQTRATSGLPLA